MHATRNTQPKGSHGSTRQGRQPPGSTASQVQPARSEPAAARPAGPAERIAGRVRTGSDLDQRRWSGRREPVGSRRPHQRPSLAAGVPGQPSSDRGRLITPLRTGDRGISLRPPRPAQHRDPDGGDGGHPRRRRARLLGVGDWQDRLSLTSGAHRGARDADARDARLSAFLAPRRTARSRPCR